MTKAHEDGWVSGSSDEYDSIEEEAEEEQEEEVVKTEKADEFKRAILHPKTQTDEEEYREINR